VRVKRDDSSLPASLVLEIFKLNLEGLTSIVPNEGKLMIAKLHEITNKKLDQKDPKYLELVNKLKGDFSNEALGSYLSYLRKKYRIQVNY